MLNKELMYKCIYIRFDILSFKIQIEIIQARNVISILIKFKATINYQFNQSQYAPTENDVKYIN